MKQKLMAFHGFIKTFIKIFNIGFFVISAGVWVVLSVQSLAGRAFDLSLLWTAFNQMYVEYSFKVACIFVILFNGLAGIQQVFQQYLDVAEHIENRHLVKRLWAAIFGGR